MIDIHAHILPGVDDGPEDWDGSLELLRMAVEDGIAGAVCTSHVLDRLNADLEESYAGKFAELKRRVRKAGIEIELWLGSEIHCFSRFDVESPLATIDGNGRYMLVEFPMGEVPARPVQRFRSLQELGVTPILAHPERNAVLLRNPELAREFVGGGVLLQVNSGSITGEFGRHSRAAAYRMVDRGMVHFVASDGHGARSRPMRMRDARVAVDAEWGREIADLLFDENPRRSVTGEPISLPQLRPAPGAGGTKGDRRKWSLFRRG